MIDPLSFVMGAVFGAGVAFFLVWRSVRRALRGR